jgi:hypothetical protein
VRSGGIDRARSSLGAVEPEIYDLTEAAQKDARRTLAWAEYGESANIHEEAW